MTDFDWYGDEDVVVREQEAIAVYRNVRGNITIRQKGILDPATLEIEDVVIAVLPQNARRLAEAILTLAASIPAPGPLALPAPADRTAAERQRRYRERKRDGKAVTVSDAGDVTRDGVTTVTSLLAHNGAGRR